MHPYWDTELNLRTLEGRFALLQRGWTVVGVVAEVQELKEKEDEDDEQN